MTTTSTPAPPAAQWRKRLKEHALRLWERLSRRRRGLSWSAVIVGGLAAAVALWPLATAVWDLLGLTSGQAWRAAVAGIGAVLLAAGVVGVNWKRTSERTSPVRLLWLILAAWAMAAGAVATMTGLAWLVLDTPQWQPPEKLSPRNLDAIATRAFAIVAGLGGVALLVISYRRQRTTEADSEREVSKLFTDTFDSASDKLGSEHAAVRLAGVHALARLADEAPEGREDLVQMVIDVLCAYLRIPYDPAPEALPKNARKDRREEHRARELEFASFREVRHTIIRIIGTRLREDTRWHGKDYDFTGVVFDGGDLSRAHFAEGEVSFREARFSGGAVDFSGARFSGGAVDFSGARFSGGQVHFSEAEFTSGWVKFNGARFSGGAVDFSWAEFTGGRVDFSWAKFTSSQVTFLSIGFSSGWVKFNGAGFSGGLVDFRGARFSGGRMNFFLAEFSGGQVDFRRIRFTGGLVDFHKAQFTGGQVNFNGSGFFGGQVNFNSSKFTGGQVNFNNSKFTSSQVTFLRIRFTGGLVDFHEARFSGGQVNFNGSGFFGGQVNFGWGGFAGDLEQFREARGACPEDLPLDQTHAGPRVLLAPQAWGEPSGHEDTDHSNEAPHTPR